MNIGSFINNVINFLIVAFVGFMAIKTMNQMRHKQEQEPEKEPPPSRKVQLDPRRLGEVRLSPLKLRSEQEGFCADRNGSASKSSHRANE
jgi:large-conductance mechanosensitive channel MscL